MCCCLNRTELPLTDGSNASVGFFYLDLNAVVSYRSEIKPQSCVFTKPPHGRQRGVPLSVPARRRLLPGPSWKAPPPPAAHRHLRRKSSFLRPQGAFIRRSASRETSREGPVFQCLTAATMTQVNSCLKRLFTAFNIFFAVSWRLLNKNGGCAE